MDEKVIGVQFGGKNRGKIVPVPEVHLDIPREADEDSPPVEPAGKDKPSAEEFVGMLRGMLAGGLGETGVGGLNRSLVNKSAQQYMETVRGYSDEQIKGFLAKKEMKTTKPAFYAAIRAVALDRKIF